MKILDCVKENILDSVHEITRFNKRYQELNKQLDEMLFSQLPEEEALQAEDVWSALTAILIKTAYLRGLQDVCQFREDMLAMETARLEDVV